jgi:hypothetical protein
MLLGRWSEATTREPGNLLPVMVTCERVGRGAPKARIAEVVLPFGAKGR